MAAKRARRLPEEGSRGAQSDPKEPKKRQGGATGATKAPKMDPKTMLFGNVLKSQNFKDVPYEINEIGALGPQKSDRKLIGKQGD